MWKRRRGLCKHETYLFASFSDKMSVIEDPYLFFLVGIVNVSLDMIDESAIQNRYFFPLAFMVQVICE